MRIGEFPKRCNESLAIGVFPYPLSMLAHDAVHGSHKGCRFTETVEVLDDLHFVGDRTIETLETHCLCAVDGGLEVVRSDLNGEVAPVQSVMPVGCLHHDLSGVLGDWLPEGSRKFLFEV